MFVFPPKIIAANWALIYCKHKFLLNISHASSYFPIFWCSNLVLDNFAHACYIQQPLSPTSLSPCQLHFLPNKTNLFLSPTPYKCINFVCDPLRLTSSLCLPQVWHCLLQHSGLSSGSVSHGRYLVFMIFFLRQCVTNPAGLKLTIVPHLLSAGVEPHTTVLSPSHPLNDPIHQVLGRYYPDCTHY